MNEYTFDYVERNRLDAFCKTVLRNEAINYLLELARRRDREKSLDTLPQAEMDKLCTLDEYPSDSFTFSAFGSVMFLGSYFCLCVLILILHIGKVSFSKRCYSFLIRSYKITLTRLFNHSLLLQFPDCFSDCFRAAPSLFCKVYVRW